MDSLPYLRPALVAGLRRAIRRPGVGRRLLAALMALWVFGGFQLLALPPGTVGSCAMVCSLDGGGCCCRLDFGSMESPTGEDRFFGRPWAEQRERACPEAATTLAPQLAADADDASAGRFLAPEPIARVVSQVDLGVSPGDTRRLDPARPPPSTIVVLSTASSSA